MRFVLLFDTLLLRFFGWYGFLVILIFAVDFSLIFNHFALASLLKLKLSTDFGFLVSPQPLL